MWSGGTHSMGRVKSATRAAREMCGIAGYHGVLAEPGEHLLRAMIDSLAHRGPDGRGEVVSGDIGLGAARLSLVDLPHGGQPMEKDGVALVFNGEIYNAGDLRRELEREGAIFSGRSDTEVVLRAFRQWGPRSFDRLEGMFAIAVRDGAVLHLARDPFGMKPLVYWLSPDEELLLFASEAKALLRCARVPRRVDPTGLTEHLVFGHTLGPRTLLGGIQQVAPGCHLSVGRRGERLVVAASPPPPPRPAPPPRSVEEAADRLTELLREAVARRVQADHPVGTYLSGGIDSTVVAALRPDRAGARSFVVADGKDVADVEHARRAAAALGLDHDEIMIERPPPVSWAVEAVLAMEAPVLPSIASVSAPRVRRWGKAALCGEGSDELFSGYPMHHEPEPYLQGFEERMRRLQGAELAEGVLATTAAKVRALRQPEPGARARSVFDFLLHETMPGKHLALWDRGAMAASLEVRMPYLDREIRDFALSLPAEWSSPRKRLLAAVAGRVLPPEIARELSSRGKSAAPDALRATRHRLRGAVASAIPPAWLRAHPLQRLSSAPHVLVMIDLFLLAFVARDGRLPEGFGIETMYARHAQALRAAHQAVREALFGG